MTELDPNRSKELAASEARYWQSLQTTLDVVFEVDPGLAVRYRSDLMEAPPLQRALALHDDPLDVAATLSGKPLTADRIALYDATKLRSAEAGRVVRRIPADVMHLGGVLSSARREENAPMVTVITLNKYMGELGYNRLAIKSGIAYFSLARKAWKRPLPKHLEMETLPGLTVDRDEVYGLDRVLNMLNGLQEFARRRKAASTIIDRIDKIRTRLLRALEL
jgi:hypothetical protein